jgi:hypothetical protein
MSALQFYSLFSTNLELPIPSLSVKPEHSVLGPEPGHPSSTALPRVRTYIPATRASGEGLTFMNFQDPPQHNQTWQWTKKTEKTKISSRHQTEILLDMLDTKSIPYGYMLLRKFILLMAEYTFDLAYETEHKFSPGGTRPLYSLTGHDTLLVSILALLCCSLHSTRSNRLMNNPSTSRGELEFSPPWTHVPLQFLLLCGNWAKSSLGSNLA